MIIVKHMKERSGELEIWHILILIWRLQIWQRIDILTSISLIIHDNCQTHEREEEGTWNLAHILISIWRLQISQRINFPKIRTDLEAFEAETELKIRTLSLSPNLLVLIKKKCIDFKDFWIWKWELKALFYHKYVTYAKVTERGWPLHEAFLPVTQRTPFFFV